MSKPLLLEAEVFDTFETTVKGEAIEAELEETVEIEADNDGVVVDKAHPILPLFLSVFGSGRICLSYFEMNFLECHKNQAVWISFSCINSLIIHFSFRSVGNI